MHPYFKDKTLAPPETLKQVYGCKTALIHLWIKLLADDKKQRFAINWKTPHSLFNVAYNLFPGGGAALQNVDWFKIFKSRDLGTWEHGGPVFPQSF